MTPCLTPTIRGYTIPELDAKEVVAVLAQRAPNRGGFALFRARNPKIVRLPAWATLHWLSKLLDVGYCGNAGDFWRVFAVDRSFHPSGGIYPLRRNGGRLLPGALAPQLFPNP